MFLYVVFFGVFLLFFSRKEWIINQPCLNSIPKREMIISTFVWWRICLTMRLGVCVWECKCLRFYSIRIFWWCKLEVEVNPKMIVIRSQKSSTNFDLFWRYSSLRALKMVECLTRLRFDIIFELCFQYFSMHMWLLVFVDLDMNRKIRLL